MKRPEDFDEIYLCVGAINFRTGQDAMREMVRVELGRNFFSGALFLFTNRRRDRIRALYWDRTGTALWAKRLEKDRFAWPMRTTSRRLQLTAEQLVWLLDGVDIEKVRPHESLQYEATS